MVESAGAVAGCRGGRNWTQQGASLGEGMAQLVFVVHLGLRAV